MRCKCLNFEPRMTTNGVNDVVVCKNCGRREDLNIDFNEQPSKPVTLSPKYTNKMFIRKELPQIGAECVFFDDTDFDFKFDWANGDKLTCLFHSTDDNGDPIGVYRHKSGVTVSLVLNLIKPITPPIELIDGECYSFESSTHGGGLGYYDLENMEFTNISMGISVNHCTNIKLLEVKSHD